ncbi:uncharacterized protein V6R79_006966 [Siganus canaliculatus]
MMERHSQATPRHVAQHRRPPQKTVTTFRETWHRKIPQLLSMTANIDLGNESLFLDMDEFVSNKLKEWGLSRLIKKFEEQEIDQESLYCLDDGDVFNLIPKVGPRSKFKKRLKSLKEEQIPTNRQPTKLPGQAEPSTSDTSNMRKRKSDFQGEPSKRPPNKKRCETARESSTGQILSDAKDAMNIIYEKLPKEGNKFIQFLKTKIKHLKTDKRELVGVFGKTGAGKSSLINAVIGEKNLLPSGDVIACTSVMIKVEANRKDTKYETEIEFITKEQWKGELQLWLNFHRDNTEQEDNTQQDDDFDGDEKLTALYGDEWKDKSPEALMDPKYFKEIPDFLNSKKKVWSCQTAAELSAELVKYTRTESNDGDGEGQKWYWPLVKCVTIRVPNNELLQHVTLVDLPGNGDCNKNRDKMWKEVVGNCSTVWIVTEVTRPVAEKEPWEILENAASIMGNGGECQQIHFICTKTDRIGGGDFSETDKRTRILNRNKQAKQKVTKKVSELHKVLKHFNEDCFRVFTVSSDEFTHKKHNKLLTANETEIPKLQEVLQDLNDCHSETLNYVSGAQGILSLIQWARSKKEGDSLADLGKNLRENLTRDTDKVKQVMDDTYGRFEKCLTEGVEESKSSCERLLHSVLYANRDGRGFHKVLKVVVENQGTSKPKKGKPINLNAKLASCLTDCIDEEFKKVFPILLHVGSTRVRNDRAHGPFDGYINTFSLGIDKLIHNYEDAELLLMFLKIEEAKMKTELSKIIRDRKKKIYNSLTTSIKETMDGCYNSKI